MNRAHLVSHVLIDDQQAQTVLDPLQPVTARQVLQVLVSVSKQDIERELLGKVTKLLAVRRTNQITELRPDPGDGCLFLDVDAHRLG